MALAPELPTSAQPQLKVDRKILVIDKVICRHIEAIAISSRGAVSQDILAQLRNFVEHIMLRFYANGRDLDVTYPNICKGIEYANTRGDLKVLRKFHDFVAIEILDPEGADERIQFDIEVEKAINGIEAYGMDFELIGSAENGNSIIRFCVYSLENADVDDNEDDTTLMPFQIAYAVSIHKAQGLEYRSVKLVVSDEIDELITHSIFYTAITRAREKLKIYWSPEVGHRVLSRIAPMNSGRDIALLKQIIRP